MKKLLPFLYLFSITAFAQTVARHYTTADFNVAVFPDTYHTYIGVNDSLRRFTPTDAEVMIAEKALKEQLAALNKDKRNQAGGPVIHQKLNNYKRQYFGYFDKNGAKVLYINCFWHTDSFSKGWLNEIIEVEDGGSYFWQVKYYPDTNELKDLQVNGYA